MSARKGVVYLVGAGPGDPGLMTARALELVASAEVIVHDRLIPVEALAGAREDAELIYVGKEPSKESVPQDQIEEMLIARARKGKSVVRLKGGDPFVFGRGGEEAEALAAAKVAFEIVPGVTAGVAAPAYAGIPVTHRDDASAVAFVTGHEDPDKPETAIDWEALAKFPGTLVFYMGVKRLSEIVERLTAAGRDPGEPAAVIERGTHPDQRVVEGTISSIADAAQQSEVQPPAVTVIGPVAERRGAIAWLESRPLHGKRIVVTRARARASELSRRLAALGADPVELPAIRIEPRIDSDEVRDAVGRLREYSLVCLTSPNGVQLLFDAMLDQGWDARALAAAQIAAIGPGTAFELLDRGISVDVMPERYVAESLVEALSKVPVEGRRVLVARAAEARDVLPDALRERGAEVDVVALYETVAERPSPDAIERAAEADYLTFTSSSTVRYLLEALPEDIASGARVVSIGPVTTEAAREAGLEVAVEAERHDLDGLIEALVADAVSRGLSRG